MVRSPRVLLIFEAAARLGSCSAAAREFNLTQPSVSRNIAELEQALDTQLFVRSPTGLSLTPHGEKLQRTLTEAFHRVDDTLHEISRQSLRKQVVELSLSTAFVTHWFVPRLREFHAAFPEVDLRFQLISGSLRGPIGSVNLGMRRTFGGQVDPWSVEFSPEIVLPVCSPAYLAANGPLDEASGDAAHTLLQLSDSEINWRTILSKAAQARIPPGNWIEFSDYAVVLQTAMGGQGVALGWVSAISRNLLDGSLVPASRTRLTTGNAFSLVAPPGRPISRIVEGIRGWLVGEMRQELDRLAPMLGTLSTTH